MAGVPVVACWDGGGLLDVVPETGAGRLTLPSRRGAERRDARSVAGPATARARQAGGRVLAGPARARRTSPSMCEGWYREALGG